MHKLILASFLTFMALGLVAQHDHEHPHKCGYSDAIQLIINENPRFVEEIEAYDRIVPDLEREGAQLARSGAVLRIPVVFHVIHSGTSIGNAANISDARILQQIQTLNNDFRRTNSDANQTPSMFQGVAADTEIEFCLATVDPNGNATTGILRHQYNNIPDQTYIENTIKPQTYWDSNKYLNIWSVDMPTNGVLGYAYLPYASIVGTSRDGLVVDYPHVGNNSSAFPASLGRTATHEIGHYLGLSHVWANANDNGGCNNDDGISDTPLSSAPYYGCPNHPQTQCSVTSMFMNYMDYVDDDCMNVFTQGQANVMRAVLSGNSTHNGVSFRSRAGLISHAAIACNTVAPGGCLNVGTQQYTMGFEQGEDLSDWGTENVNNDVNGTTAVTWRTHAVHSGNLYGPKTGARFAGYLWNTNGTTAANDWLFTPCFDVVNGHTYRVRFSYACASSNGTVYPEKFKVTLNTDQTAASSIYTINDFGTINNAYPSYLDYSGDFVISGNGELHIGFHCYSDADKYMLHIDDFSLIDLTLLANEEVTNTTLEDITLFPNPSDGVLNVKLIESIDIQDNMFVHVYNATGALLARQTVDAQQTSIDVRNFPDGLYILQFQFGSNVLSKTFVVQH
jgi:predicted Zn-dependent protease